MVEFEMAVFSSSCIKNEAQRVLPFYGRIKRLLQGKSDIHQTNTPGAPCLIALSKQLLQAARGINGNG